MKNVEHKDMDIKDYIELVVIVLILAIILFVETTGGNL